MDLKITKTIKNSENLQFEVWDDDFRVGFLTVLKKENKLIAFNCFVDPKYRRKGVATYLYDKVEEALNQKLTPFEYFDQTAQSSLEIVEFWRKRGKVLTRCDKFFDC